MQSLQVANLAPGTGALLLGRLISCLPVGGRKLAAAVLDQALEALGREIQHGGVGGTALVFGMSEKLRPDDAVHLLLDRAQLLFAARVPYRDGKRVKVIQRSCNLLR